LSQKLRFEHLTLSDGLSNGRISCIEQDSTGFIWIGTNDGLNRFDGMKFKVFNHRPSDTNSISSNTIFSILCNGDKVWIGTRKGIDYYSSTEEIFYHIPIVDTPGYKENIYISKVFRDFKNRFFIATSRGLYLYNEQNKIFNKYFIPERGYEKLNRNEITCISQDRDSILWIGTQDLGVFTFHERKKLVSRITHFKNKINTLLNNKIFCIYEDNFNTIWIGSNEGLYAYNKNNGNILRYSYEPSKKNWLPHISVNTIFEDSRNNLWLATNGGLSKFNRKDASFTNYFHDDYDENSISNNSVRCIFDDFQHNLWIGSGENGINILKSKTIEFENFKRIPNKLNSLNYGYILSIMEDHQNNLWLGTNGGGIDIFETKTQQFKYLFPPTANISGRFASAILSLLEDNEGKIWIGTYLGGLVEYDQKTKKYLTYEFNPDNKKGLSNNIVNYLIQDSKKNIWIATNGGGVDILNKTTNQINNLRANSNSKSSLSNDFCTILYEDKKGIIWIGSYYGLNMFNPVTGINKIFLNNNQAGAISSDVVYSIYEDSKGRLWFGTDFGLNLLDSITKTFKTYTVEEGLPNNVINGILEDSHGYLWISTNKGLSKFDPELKKTTNYDLEDGLATLDYYHGAYFKSSKGIFYFGGTEGLTFFNPDKLGHGNYKAPLVFIDFYINNQTISPKQNSVLKSSITKAKRIVLNYDQSFINIDFTSLNFVNPNKDNFAYYLEGFDKQWNNIRNKRSASYTNLPPGNYTFYVKVTNENGNETYNSLYLIVKPPFWKTNYAYIFYVLLLCSLLYFIYSYLHSRTLYKQNLLVERIEKEKAIEINQAKIRFFINVSHDFKTPLTLIISPLEKLISSGNMLNPDERNHLYHLIYRNTLRLSRLINQVMDLRKIDTGNMKLYVTKNELVAFIKEIAVSFEEYAKNHSIDFSVESKFPSIILWFDIDKIEKVVYNILSNAFRYTHDGKSIKIIIDKPDKSEIAKIDPSLNPDGCIKIRVIDQGVGIPEDQHDQIFNRFHQVQTESLANPASSGIGLSIAKEFVEMHKGWITVKSKVKQGSEFSVILPLGQKHFKNEDLAMDKSYELTEKIESDIVKTGTNVQTENLYKVSLTDIRKKYKVLIVDDNYELRNFLLDNLQRKYNVLEASNGKEGLDIIYNHFPDLVVSDVMMPSMNGIELCKAIKADIKISHIPIILLTVLNSINNQIEGYEIGADDYVTKPFDLNLLEARIFNLIETRKKIIKKFIEELKPDPKSFSHNILDEKFIQKAVEIVNINISNYEFSAVDFAEQIRMSRSNLHIKLKSLTNQSATEFIRLIRLKKATEILSVNQHNISEVSYMVGFNSISYFNRCFKKQFGLTPSEFLNNGFKIKSVSDKD